MIEYPDADRLMAGELGTWLEGQAQVRADAVAQSWDRIFKAGMVLLPLAAFLIILVPIELAPKLWLSGLAFAGAWAWSQVPKSKAKKQVKTGINEAIADALGLAYRHDCDATEAFEIAREFQLLPKHQKRDFEDLWEGETAGHAFSLHEAHLQERRGSGKNRRWVTVFRGAIVSIGFERPFHGTTLLAKDGQFSKLFGGAKDSVKLDGRVLQRADMVSPEFEDRFDVYTTDPTEARWLIHPEYIERLLKLEALFRGKGSAVVFTGGTMILALESGNMFESGSLDPQADRAMVAQTIRQFAGIADMALTMNRIRPASSEPRG